jgi:hypothetical protein
MARTLSWGGGGEKELDIDTIENDSIFMWDFIILERNQYEISNSDNQNAFS